MLKQLSTNLSMRIYAVVGSLSLFLISCQDYSGFIRPLSTIIGFDSGSQDWTVDKNAKGGYSKTGGNPGGYIYGIDNSNDPWFFLASDSLIQQSRKGYGKILRFDLQQDAMDEQAITTDDVVLSDGVITLTYSTSCNPATTWTAYSVKLDELSGWKKNNKAVIKAEFQRVLTNLNELKIRGEYRFGPDRGGLDNVSLN